MAMKNSRLELQQQQVGRGPTNKTPHWDQAAPWTEIEPCLVVVSSDLSRGGQSAHLTELLRLEPIIDNPHSLRLRIKSDSHREQSHAIIERWSGDRWDELWRVPTYAMQTETSLAYLPEGKLGRDAFDLDRTRLIVMAYEVLR